MTKARVRQLPETKVAYVPQRCRRYSGAWFVLAVCLLLIGVSTRATEEKAANAPADAKTYYNSGVNKLHMKDIRGALADLSKAIELDPKNPTSFELRARAKVLNGEYEGARIDFRKTIQLAKESDAAAHARFHLFLLNLRLKYSQSLPDFKEAVHGCKDEWKKSVGLFLAGEIDEAAFLSLAANGDPTKVRELLCEAFYYAGMVRLLKGDAAGAQSFFEKSLATEVSNFVEFDFAGAELARLHPKR
jgi:lipoprotein NlpI